MELQAWLADLLATWGLLALFPVGVVEGPVVSVLAGVLAGQALLPLVPAYALLTLADLTGDAALYALGRWGGAGAARWLAPRHRRGPRRLAVGLRRRGWRLLVWGKVTHAAGFAVLIAAGAARMPFLPFLLVSAPLSAAKTALLVGLGWAVGGALAPLMAEPLPLLAGLATLALLALPLILLPPKEHRRHVLPPRFRRPDPRA